MDELILPPKAWEKRLAEVQEFAQLNGLSLAGRCKHCGSVITDPKSLAVNAGSVCRTRHKENDGPVSAAPAKKSRTDKAA